MPEAITTIALENKSIILTWQQPDNIFMESVFTYNITALLVTTGHVLDQRTITLESLESPREVYNFTEVELCEEIRFTLTQAGDCREQQISTFLPICKETFNLYIVFNDEKNHQFQDHLFRRYLWKSFSQ